MLSADGHQVPPTLWALLCERAADAPDRPFVELDDDAVTYAQAQRRVAALCAGLRAQGLRSGDRLAIFARNSLDAVLVWIAANAAGIVDVPLNVEARGASLRTLFADARPVAIAVDADGLARLAESGCELPALAILLDGCDGAAVPAGTRPVSVEALRDAVEAEPELDAAALAQGRAGDLATILYSSGTTGPSKGVMLPQGHYPGWGRILAEMYELAPGERLYCAQPLYHVDARGAVTAAASAGAAVTLARRFSVRRFWSELRACRADKFQYVGTMLWLLFKQEPSPEDAAHGAVLAAGSSTPEEIRAAFEQRFGVTLLETYGMTEGFVLAASTRTARRPASVGRPTRGVELAVVDDEDRPLAPDAVGEIVFRPREPGLVSPGYWGRPEATVAAWRNLWFHTGDLGSLDADGFLHYAGRKKDSIRRRGENVSAWEVEQAITAHPAVAEVAAFGVPSDVGEEDVAALVVARAGGAPDPAELHAFAAAELPAFAVPRFIELVEALPKTPSERIDKGAVRRRGLGPAPWDAESARLAATHNHDHGGV